MSYKNIPLRHFALAIDQIDTIPGLPDDVLADIRKGLPKYLNDMTEEDKTIQDAIWTEQDKRFKAKQKKRNDILMADTGLKHGDYCKRFAPSWFGAGSMVYGKVIYRNGWLYVKLLNGERYSNGQKQGPLSAAWQPLSQEEIDYKKKLKKEKVKMMVLGGGQMPVDV